MTDIFFFNHFNPKLGYPILSHSQVLVNAHVCCCCSLRCFVIPSLLVSFSTVKQQPGTVLPPCGTTDYCKTNWMCMQLWTRYCLACQWTTALCINCRSIWKQVMVIYCQLQNRLYWRDAHENRMRLIAQPYYKVCAVTNKSGGARTILMTKFTSRRLYAVPRARVKSEVYFGLNNP